MSSKLVVLIAVLHGCTAGTNLDSHFKATITKRTDFISTITVSNGRPEGSWKPAVYCPEGTYASGYAMKIEPPQGGWKDDTALNNIALFCTDRFGCYKKIVVSSSPGRGSWSDSWKCSGKDTFFTKFSLQVEPPQGNGDDTAANYVKFQCRGMTGEQNEAKNLTSGSGHWGTFGTWSAQCPLNSVVCGMTVRFQSGGGDPFMYQPSGDDTALNDVKFHCCGMKNCS